MAHIARAVVTSATKTSLRIPAAAFNPQGRTPALLARAFLELGDYSDALDQAEEALRRAPGNKDTLEVRWAARQHLEREHFK